MKTPNQHQHQPGAAHKLLLADLLLGYARRLENLGAKRARLERHVSAFEAGEVAHNPEGELLLSARTQRDAGVVTDDALFFIIAWLAERSVEHIYETDVELKRLGAKMRVIEKREGLEELDEFAPGSEPADWKVLAAKSDRRYQAVEKIEREGIIRWLRHHGELDMADLLVNDPDTFDARREAGRCFYHGPGPDTSAATSAGDTGLTEVVTSDK